MPELILLVDDDRQILDGYRRSRRREFLIDTVMSGLEALSLIESKGPYAVVISDMRVQGMDGIEFLGALLISRGQEVTLTVIFKLKNFQSRRSIAGDVLDRRRRPRLRL